MKKMVKVIAIATIAASMSVIPAVSFAKPAPQKQEMPQKKGNKGAKKAPAGSKKAPGAKGGKIEGARNGHQAGTPGKARGGNSDMKGRNNGPASGPQTPKGGKIEGARNGRQAGTPGKERGGNPDMKGRNNGPAAGPETPAAAPKGPAKPHRSSIVVDGPVHNHSSIVVHDEPRPKPEPAPAPRMAPAPAPVAPAPAPVPASSTTIIYNEKPTGLFGRIGNLIDDTKAISDEIKH